VGPLAEAAVPLAANRITTGIPLIDRRLGVMDVSAIDLCLRSKIPIIVLNLKKPGNMRAVILGEGEGTLIDGGATAATKPRSREAT
jgi:uridylate kinase